MPGRLRSKRLAGLSLVVAAMLLGPAATALAATPRTGDWEGTAAHGLPLSFDLARRHGRLVATNVTVGFGESCPAQARDTETVPLTHPAYFGPGAGERTGSTAVLSGREQGFDLTVSGDFPSSHTGTFSLLTSGKLACWPKLSRWTVHPARRRKVASGVWQGSMTGADIVTSTLTITVAAQGRVMNGFSGNLTCSTAGGAPASENFASVPAYEFIHANGSFASPLSGQDINGVETLWSATFGSNRHLTGTIKVSDPCTGHAVQLALHAAAPGR